MADPQTKTLYEEAAKAKGKPVFSLTIADFFNAPSVEEVDLSAYSGAVGDEIMIMASDDFDVASVEVALSDESGTPLALRQAQDAGAKSGAAVETPADSGRWVNTATADVPTGTTVRIAVTASDRPGGVGSVEEEKAL